MEHMNRTHFGGTDLLAAWLVLVSIAAGCQSTDKNATGPEGKPAAQDAGRWLAPPPAREVLRVKASGVQIYKAETGDDGQMKWTLVGPEAELRDEMGRVVGKHYRDEPGPVWESSDGSKVFGKKRAERKSPHSDSVRELQLDARPVAGAAAGVLTNVTFIERLDTAGGVPPAATPGTAIGQVTRSPYTAEYVFYAPQ
jgi:hypothetical protein